MRIRLTHLLVFHVHVVCMHANYLAPDAEHRMIPSKIHTYGFMPRYVGTSSVVDDMKTSTRAIAYIQNRMFIYISMIIGTK